MALRNEAYSPKEWQIAIGLDNTVGKAHGAGTAAST